MPDFFAMDSASGASITNLGPSIAGENGGGGDGEEE